MWVVYEVDGTKVEMCSVVVQLFLNINQEYKVNKMQEESHLTPLVLSVAGE